MAKPTIILIERCDPRDPDIDGRSRFRPVGKGMLSVEEGYGDETLRITLQPDDRSQPGKTSYAVYAENGDHLGRVYQELVTHDRKPKGSRVVTHRTRSNRWRQQPASYFRRPSQRWADTRGLAVADLLRSIDSERERSERIEQDETEHGEADFSGTHRR